MADWEFKPWAPYRIERSDPPTLVTEYEDGTTDVREKSTATYRTFYQRFRESASLTKTKVDFAKGKKLSTSFTMLTFDPAAASPSTDSATVRFVSYPESVQDTGDVIETNWVMREVL